MNNQENKKTKKQKSNKVIKQFVLLFFCFFSFLKKANIIILLFISFLIISGCTTKNQTEEKASQQTQNQQNQDQQAAEDQRQAWNENFEQASLNDLAEGQRVLVMGVENDDGSITAQSIMIGNIETNFDEVAPMSIRVRGGEGQGEGANSQNFQPPEGMPDFQNMSEEERAQFREQMMAQRGEVGLEGRGNFQPSNTGQKVVRLGGEVIKKDEEGITIKLDEGGSKFVFLSASTTVVKIK